MQKKYPEICIFLFFHIIKYFSTLIFKILGFYLRTSHIPDIIFLKNYCNFAYNLGELLISELFLLTSLLTFVRKTSKRA